MDQNWQNLSGPIFAHAAARPDAPALIEGPTQLSYRELAALIAKATVYLRELGIGQGDRIGVALTNSIDHIVLSFALLRLGATLVGLPVEDSAEALAATAGKYGIRTIFTEAHTQPPAGLARIRVDVAWRGRIERLNGDYRSATGGDALQVFFLTTGSTGVPCGWVMTHRDVIGRAVLFDEWRNPPGTPLRPPPNLVVVLPLRYVWSLSSVVHQFAIGGPVILLPEFAKPADLLRAVAAWDDAIFSVTPNACRYFLRVAPPIGYLLPRMRRLETAGQLLYAEEKRGIATHVTPNFFEGYGTTAGGFLTCLNPTDTFAKADTVGSIVPGMEVEVVGPLNAALPVGAAGSIRCRPLFAQGQCAEDSGRGSEYIEDGWCYTGDIGFFDADGFLHLKGRGTDIIRRGAVEVFAPEIETVLLSHPAVADAAVVGVPRPGRSDEIVAFVVKRGDLAHDEIARHCGARLAADRLPDRIFYTEVLPRIPGGKVNRVRLLEAAAEEIARLAPRGL